MDEIQNKAEAQPAWLQLAAGAAARTLLSLAIVYSLDFTGFVYPFSPLSGWLEVWCPLLLVYSGGY